MSKRLFDRSSYSKRTLDTFEILAAYFVDIYYNHLYIEAKKAKADKKTTNITEGYKHSLNAYIRGVENPKLYKKTLTGIHDYFVASGFSSMNFVECIERITKEFIPEDFYSSVSRHQKINLLKTIICQSNKVFLEKIVRKFIALLIDNHEDVDNIRVLQDEFIHILMIERDSIYNKFIVTSGSKSAPNIKIVESMQEEIKTLITEKLNLKTMITNLKKIIIKKDRELQDEKKNNEFIVNNNSELQHEINELKRHMNEVNKIESINFDDRGKSENGDDIIPLDNQSDKSGDSAKSCKTYDSSKSKHQAKSPLQDIEGFDIEGFS